MMKKRKKGKKWGERSSEKSLKDRKKGGKKQVNPNWIDKLQSPLSLGG